MGAQQSSGRDASPQNGAAPKTCHYEVLGVDRHATDDEIKKAYRRKALELHPDRNYGDVDNATVKFAEVSSAWEVLSDPQERAWYDSHRESILRGDGGGEADHFEHNVRLTSAGDLVSLIGKFSTSIPFTDAPNGFYGILRDTFARLASEEDSACDWAGLEVVDYPDFGYAGDNYEDAVKPFYRVWVNFTTKKSFSWRDAYRASDAPDRATRRLIDKENKRLREEGIREFNDTVRSLVVFVRKRDPRYIPNSQTEADRQRILRDAAAAQAARSRAANQAKFGDHVIPDWAKSHEPGEAEEFTESEESEVEQIECVVCNKTFKSEKQYEAHEKSKKHIKAVQQLQWEMKKENKLLNLDTPASNSSTNTPVSELDNLHLNASDIEVGDTTAPDLEENEKIPSIPGLKDYLSDNLVSIEPAVGTTPDSLSDSSELNDEYAPREDVESRIDSSLARNETTGASNFKSTVDPPTISDFDGPDQPKLGKAKAKRAKKAAKQQETETMEGLEYKSAKTLQFKCAACGDSFMSKTKLFNHIKELNHAQPLSKAKGKNKKR
ncbi:J protein JJJ1 [Lachnellula subtilissima]|uniref:J protein JJJ1 n=1 Tax=Lachnellula subtilissima TaxID=602034 RepID=A0A8H8RKQ1_9HELO|nr:J protein JJJ1 [Lachnellula subtilissima]